MKTCCLFVFLSAVAVSVLAGSYQVVHQERIDGAESFRYIDPVIGYGQSQTGFIFTDSINRRLMVDFIAADSTITYLTPQRPVMTINVWTPDSILIFVLSRDMYLQWPELRRIRLLENLIHDSARFVQFPGWKGNVDDIWHQRISFGSIQPGASGIILEQCILCDNYETTQGWEYKATSAAGIYDFEFNPQLGLKPVTTLRPANLTIDPGLEYAWHNRYYYTYDFSDYNDPDNYGTETHLYSGVSVSAGDTLSSSGSESGDCLQLFAGDFIPENDLDEVLFYGSTADMTEQHPAAWHAACYSFETGAPEEIWYTPLSGVSLDYVYKPQHYIAGMRGQNKVVMLNYWTGQLCDSIDLGRNLTALTFFETGTDPSVLNLVGRNYDTIFVYQFQTPTDAPTEPSETLPASFSLEQNYPNPFNATTELRFQNDRRQKLTLRIYNILGQEVATPYDADTPAGDVSVSWDGLDAQRRPVASGIYFARLSSVNELDLIKMVLLK